MTVVDNGTGFNGSASFMGNGLKNMKERAENHQWQLTIQSNPGEGTVLALKAVIA
jgi:signal transduction histidine kinase